MKILPGLLAAAALAASAPAVAQLVDFAQFDTTQDVRSLVLVKALKDGDPKTPDPLLSAGYTKWLTGSTASVSYVHRWALNSGTHNFTVGAGLGANTFRGTRGEPDKNGLSARGQAEMSGPIANGSYYGLLQLSTFRGGTLGLVQYNPSESRLGFEVSAYRETGYHHTAFAARLALDAQKRWGLRLGVLRTSDETQPFIGLSYNAF